MPRSRPGDANEPEAQDRSSWTRLLSKAQGGSSTALHALIERWRRWLRRRATGRLPDWARGHGVDTSDIVQDSLVRMMAPLLSFTPEHPGALRSYLRRVVDNRIRDELRKRRRVPFTGDLRDDLRDSTDRFAGVETRDRYRKALDRLKRRDRRLVSGRLDVGLSIRELAHMDGRTKGAVDKALARATAAARALHG